MSCLLVAKSVGVVIHWQEDVWIIPRQKAEEFVICFPWLYQSVIFYSGLGVPECERVISRCVWNTKLFVVKLTSHPQPTINRCHCMHSNVYTCGTTYKGCISALAIFKKSKCKTVYFQWWIKQENIGLELCSLFHCLSVIWSVLVKFPVSFCENNQQLQTWRTFCLILCGICRCCEEQLGRSVSVTWMGR